MAATRSRITKQGEYRCFFCNVQRMKKYVLTAINPSHRSPPKRNRLPPTKFSPSIPSTSRFNNSEIYAAEASASQDDLPPPLRKSRHQSKPNYPVKPLDNTETEIKLVKKSSRQGTTEDEEDDEDEVSEDEDVKRAERNLKPLPPLNEHRTRSHTNSLPRRNQRHDLHTQEISDLDEEVSELELEFLSNESEGDEDGIEKLEENYLISEFEKGLDSEDEDEMFLEIHSPYRNANFENEDEVYLEPSPIFDNLFDYPNENW